MGFTMGVGQYDGGGVDATDVLPPQSPIMEEGQAALNAGLPAAGESVFDYAWRRIQGQGKDILSVEAGVRAELGVMLRVGDGLSGL